MTMPFDLFVSYARLDNQAPPGAQGGLISSFVERLEEEHMRSSRSGLDIFFDKSDIHVMEDWRHRILQGLKESKVLLMMHLYVNNSS